MLCSCVKHMCRQMCVISGVIHHHHTTVCKGGALYTSACASFMPVFTILRRVVSSMTSHAACISTHLPASNCMCMLNVQAYAALEASNAQQMQELAAAQMQIKQLGKEASASGASNTNLQKQQQVCHVPVLQHIPEAHWLMTSELYSPYCHQF